MLPAPLLEQFYLPKCDVRHKATQVYLHASSTPEQTQEPLHNPLPSVCINIGTSTSSTTLAAEAPAINVQQCQNTPIAITTTPTPRTATPSAKKRSRSPPTTTATTPSHLADFPAQIVALAPSTLRNSTANRITITTLLSIENLSSQNDKDLHAVSNPLIVDMYSNPLLEH